MNKECHQIHQIHEIEVPIDNQQSSSSVMISENLLPLDPSLIPSSPVDIMTYKIARTALNEYMHENSVFPTPIKTFIDRYIKSLDRVWIRNSIVKAKYNTLKGVSTDRKRTESGVRAVLKGYHVVIRDEVFERIVEAQSLARKRKIRKGHKGEVRSSSPSNEEDIVPVDYPQSSGGPMEDCIVVQF